MATTGPQTGKAGRRRPHDEHPPELLAGLLPAMAAGPRCAKVIGNCTLRMNRNCEALNRCLPTHSAPNEEGEWCRGTMPD